MNQTHLTSFLVFNYLKKRSLQPDQPNTKMPQYQSLRNSYEKLRGQQLKEQPRDIDRPIRRIMQQPISQKLFINMEYEEYKPAKMPTIKSNFFNYPMSNNKYKSLYDPTKKQPLFTLNRKKQEISHANQQSKDQKKSLNSNQSTQKTKNLAKRDIEAFKRMRGSSYQNQNSSKRKNQGKKNKRAFNISDIMYNPLEQEQQHKPDQINQFRGHSELKSKFGSLKLQTKLDQGNGSFFQRINKNREKKKRNSKYMANIRFGLEIRQVKKIRKSENQKNEEQNYQFKSIDGSNQIANQRKLQEICDQLESLKPSIVLLQNLTLQSSQKQINDTEAQKGENKCMTQKSQMMTKLSKALPRQVNLKLRKSVFSTKEKNISEQRSVQNRIEKMYNAFSVILYSFGCFAAIPQKQPALKNRSLKRKDDKFLYYVGNGNNKNLIRSVMKKKWWWVQTDDYLNANFVWTQIKIHAVLQNQASMRFSLMQIADPENYRANHQNKIAQGFSLKNNTQNKKQLQNHYKRLFHPQMKQKFYRKLPNQEQKNCFLRQLKPPAVLHNHYEANYMMGNKKALFKNLTEYYNFLGKNVFQIIPLTFHIQKINSKSWKLFQSYANDKKNSLWVVKPGENSNRGQGIFVSNAPAKIKAKIQSKKGKDSSRTYIIQKYIKNLFLFNRRKFDIRTYMMMLTIGGVQKFFWYQQGYLRTSSQIYDTNDFDDIQIHLTNDAVQCKNQNYGKYEAGNKISYHQFQRYLDTNFPNANFQVKEINQKMKNIASQAVKSTYFKIDPAMKQQSFQIFGIDFIIDSKFNPWLIQINTNPCLQLSAPCLQRLIPRMLQNAFRLAIDPVYQPLMQCPRSFQCYIPENLLMFDSLFDRNLEWEKYSSQKTQNIEYEDQDDVFDNDGQQINIDF